MVMTKAGFANELIPGLYRVTSDKFKQLPDVYSRVFKVVDSNKSVEDGQLIEGFGAASEKNEGAAVEYVELTQGYKTSFTNLTFSRGTRVTREAYDDDRYNVFKGKLGTYLARSIKQRREVLAFNVFNNGFATTGADGKVLFATDHPYISGGTYSNRLATGADLSATSLQDLITVGETTLDPGSINIQLIIKQLIVAPANRWVAKTILKSTQDPDSANNAINPLKDENLELIVSHYMTDSGQWVLRCDEHGLLYFNRQAPKLEADDDFDTGDAKLKITMRAVAGYDDPRGVLSST